MRVGVTVSPLAHCGLDEALRFAVGPGGIGPCTDMPKAELMAGVTEGLRHIGGAVIGHDPLDLYAEAGVINDRKAEEADRTGDAFVGIEFGQADAGVVINADMEG